MTPPTWFVNALQREFRGRLRLRWSILRGEWHLEQQVGRAALPTFRRSEADDDFVRMRDGYAFVMAIRPGDRMPCPTCGLTVKVPILETREAVCSHCQAKGRDGRYLVAYYPLGEVLLEHLRRIDPLRGGIAEVVQHVDTANRLRDTGRERAIRNYVGAVARDDFGYIFDIPQVGYTGRERAWAR